MKLIDHTINRFRFRPMLRNTNFLPLMIFFFLVSNFQVKNTEIEPNHTVKPGSRSEQV